MGRFSKLESGTAPRKLEEERSRIEEAQKTREVEEKYDAPYYIKLADQYFFYGEFDKALRYYSRALQMENSIPYPWIGQIFSLLEMGQTKEAGIWVTRALEFFPENSDVIALQAVVFAYRGMLKRAIGASDFAMSKGSGIYTWIARGEVLLIAEKKAAHFCFEKAMELTDHEDWRTPMRIGLIYYKHKQYSYALDFFKRAVHINVTNYYLWYHIGQSNYHLGFNNKAREAFERSLEHNPDFKQAKAALVKTVKSSIFSRIFRRLRGKKH